MCQDLHTAPFGEAMLRGKKYLFQLIECVKACVLLLFENVDIHKCGKLCGKAIFRPVSDFDPLQQKGGCIFDSENLIQLPKDKSQLLRRF